VPLGVLGPNPSVNRIRGVKHCDCDDWNEPNLQDAERVALRDAGNRPHFADERTANFGAVPLPAGSARQHMAWDASTDGDHSARSQGDGQPVAQQLHGRLADAVGASSAATTFSPVADSSAGQDEAAAGPTSHATQALTAASTSIAGVSASPPAAAAPKRSYDSRAGAAAARWRAG